MNTGEKIKYLRDRDGLTLEALGEKVGVGKSTVRKWEKGMIANMGRDKIAKLAEAFDVSPSYFISDDIDFNGVKIQPASEESGLDEYDVQLRELIKHLSREQKIFLVAQLQTLIANQGETK